VTSGPHPARRAWWRVMLADLQFWIPVGVLAGGLALLRWVA
jgi:hypothetical protein